MQQANVVRAQNDIEDISKNSQKDDPRFLGQVQQANVAGAQNDIEDISKNSQKDGSRFLRQVQHANAAGARGVPANISLETPLLEEGMGRLTHRIALRDSIKNYR